MLEDSHWGFRKPLLIAGALLTLLSSVAIEVCLVLLFTDMPREPLRNVILVGVGGVAVGGVMMWMSRRCSRRL